MDNKQSEITKEDIDKLVVKLKKYSNAWVAEVGMKMYGDIDHNKRNQRVYNITNDLVKSQEIKRDFVSAALSVIEDKEKLTQKLKDKIQ